MTFLARNLGQKCPKCKSEICDDFSKDKLPFLLKAVVLPFSVVRPRLLGRHEVTVDSFFRQLPRTAMLFGNATEPVEKEKYMLEPKVWEYK